MTRKLYLIRRCNSNRNNNSSSNNSNNYKEIMFNSSISKIPIRIITTETYKKLFVKKRYHTYDNDCY